MRRPLSSWTKLADIDALSYSTYRSSGDQAGFPTINVEVDPNPARRRRPPLHDPRVHPELRLGRQWFVADVERDESLERHVVLDDEPLGDFQGLRSPAPSRRPVAMLRGARSKRLSVRQGQGRPGPERRLRRNFVGNVDNFTVGTRPANTTIFDFEPVCTTVCLRVEHG